MGKRKWFIIIGCIGVIVMAGYFFGVSKKEKAGTTVTYIHPEIGPIKLSVSTTGSVKPQNRLEIKPSISGRIEDILVKEGDTVKKGDILAWMSSTERAALIDAATSQGKQEQQYWEDVYKRTPIIAPLDGKVIVRSFEPGQTITTSDALLVLSDRLTVSAQFDETDIGRVKMDQKAIITLDAYPEHKINGIVDHIAYESELVNNVTIYNVDIVPREVPDFFRSGMSADVEVIDQFKKEALLIPVNAIQYEESKAFVQARNASGRGSEKRMVQLGLVDTNEAEVVFGLSASDEIAVKDQHYSPIKRQSMGSSPFMPSPKKKK